MSKIIFKFLILLLPFLVLSKQKSRKHLQYGDWKWNCKCLNFNDIGECLKIHCDVDKDTSISCFSIFSKVELPSGDFKHLKDLTFNEEIITLNENLERRTDRFIGFLHLDENKPETFLNITTLSADNQTNFILITPKHLIFKENNDAIFAERLTVSDNLIDQNGNLSKIISIEKTQFQGVAAPLTESGTALVDGYWTSNYAFYEDHNKAHFAFLGYRTAAKLFGDRVSARNENGLLKYADFLMKLKNWMKIE